MDATWQSHVLNQPDVLMHHKHENMIIILNIFFAQWQLIIHKIRNIYGQIFPKICLLFKFKICKVSSKCIITHEMHALLDCCSSGSPRGDPGLTHKTPFLITILFQTVTANTTSVVCTPDSVPQSQYKVLKYLFIKIKMCRIDCNTIYMLIFVTLKNNVNAHTNSRKRLPENKLCSNPFTN